MASLTKTPLASFSTEWTYLKQTMVPSPTVPATSKAPVGMVSIPAGSFTFQAKGMEVEGDDSFGVDFQFPWESHPQREHSKTIDVATFFIDRFPVTTANYS